MTGDLDFFVLNAVLERFRYTVVGINLKTFKAKKAAVLYALANDYSKGLAEIFRDDFNKKSEQVYFLLHSGNSVPIHSILLNVIGSNIFNILFI